MKNRIQSVRAFFARNSAKVLTGGVLLASTAASRAEDITATLGTAATACITGVLTVVGTILVAGIAIPVAKKAYSIVKSALGRA